MVKLELGLESHCEPGPKKEIVEVISEKAKERLLTDLKKSNPIAFDAAEKILEYVRERKLEPALDYLKKVLTDLKTKRHSGEGSGAKIAELKSKAAIMIKERGLLNESSLSIILNEVDSQETLENVIGAYLEKNDAPNYILKATIRIIESLDLKEILATRLLSQDPNADDLIAIIEELEDPKKFPSGSPLQLGALKKLWEIGMKPEDFIWLIEDVKSLAKAVWERGKKEGIIEKLSIEQLNEIFRYTEALKVKTEARKELLSRLEEELERLRKALKRNLANTKIQYRLWDLEKIEEEVKR